MKKVKCSGYYEVAFRTNGKAYFRPRKYGQIQEEREKKELETKSERVLLKLCGMNER